MRWVRLGRPGRGVGEELGKGGFDCGGRDVEEPCDGGGEFGEAAGLPAAGEGA